MKNKIIAVTGMTGVGKDYLVDRAKRDLEIPIFNWGTLLGTELCDDRDAMMHTKDARAIRACQFIVCRKILARQPAIVTCHTVRQENNYTYDLELETAFSPACYAFVCAPADLIQERVANRNQRGERKSPEFSLAEIDETQQIKLAAVGELAMRLECELLVLHNVADELETNVQSLREKINQICY